MASSSVDRSLLSRENDAVASPPVEDDDRGAADGSPTKDPASGAGWGGLGRAAEAAIVDVAPSSNTHLSEKRPGRDSGGMASDDDVASNTNSKKRIGPGFVSSLRSSIVWKWSDWSGGGARGGKGGGFEVGAVREDDDKDHDDDEGRRDSIHRRAAGAAG